MNKRGFTLAEILVVVTIIGVLAAIVVPQFPNASTDARKVTLVKQLHAVRVQIQLYTLQHGDQTPDLGNWDPLVTQTTYDGQTCGPYLRDIPWNTLNKFTGVAMVDEDPRFGDAVSGTNIGFVYNPNTGFLYATNTKGDRIYNEANPNDPNN